MKKLLFLILFISLSFLGHSQYNITQNLGGPTTLVQNPNYGGFRGGLIPYTFSDTTSANGLATSLKLYNGALIYCTADNAVYWRDATNQKWVQLLPSGGTGGLSAWLTTGNFAVPTDVNGYAKFGTFGTNGINVITSGNTVFKIHANGIVPDTGTVQGLGVNSYGELSYFSGGGSTPTWQQTLDVTNGKVLTGNNIIDGNQFNFEFNGGGGGNEFVIQGYGSVSLQDEVSSTIVVQNGITLSQTTGGANPLSIFTLNKDSIVFRPNSGSIYIDTLNNETSLNTLTGWTSTSGSNRGKIGYVTIGTGLSLSSGTLSSNGSANLTSTYIGYGSGSNTLTGDANLTYTAASSAVVLDSGYLSFTGHKDFGSSVTGSIFKSSLYGLTFRGVPGASYDMLFFTQGGSTLFANPTGTTQMGTVGDWGFGLLGSTISAKVHITAGTASAGTAPLKFNAGTNLTSPEAGAMEWNGTNLFITQTTGPTRQTIAYASDLTFWNLNGTSTLTGGVTIDGSGVDYDLKGNKSGINIASRVTTIGDYLAAGSGTKIIVDESNDKLFMISAAISGATIGDALTVVDPSSGEIGVAPNLAFMLRKDSTDMYTSNGRIFVKDAAGNRTQISPHNDKGEWIYRSTDKDGVTTEINMIRLAELLEKITGEKLIYKTKE